MKYKIVRYWQNINGTKQTILPDDIRNINVFSNRFCSVRSADKYLSYTHWLYGSESNFHESKWSLKEITDFSHSNGGWIFNIEKDVGTL